MRCPIDGTDLVITDRSGVEIDYCPKCRGVWLDRGELDKIIDRSAAQMPPPAPRASGPSGFSKGGYDQRSFEQRRSDSGYRKKSKAKGFLEDLFDF
jgi:Zn-finger nucleic acid-binding protein